MTSDNSRSPLYIVAPIQGSTNRLWRRLHRSLYPGAIYIAPFVHIEHHAPRNRDLRDIDGDDVSSVIPQIIARDADEFLMALDAVTALGYSRVNLNMGCPHPPRTSRGRGAGLLLHPDRLAAIVNEINRHPDLRFSVKMRLGVDKPDQWHESLSMLNDASLEWVAVHPRTARQLYRGDIDLEQWAAILDRCVHPVVFNGDITSPDQVAPLLDRYPKAAGIMAGRGVLAMPSLLHDAAFHCVTSAVRRIDDIITIHDSLLDQYAATLCGDARFSPPSSPIGITSPPCYRPAQSSRSSRPEALRPIAARCPKSTT